MFNFDEAFWSNFFFSILNLIVLYFILKKILFRPVTNHMTDRANKIQEAIDSAARTKDMIEEMKLEYDEKIRNSTEEGKKIVNEYIDKANKEYEDILKKAKESSNKLIDEAREEIEIEKKQALMEIKEEISDLVLRVGEKLIKKNLDDEDNRKIISDFIKDESVA